MKESETTHEATTFQGGEQLEVLCEQFVAECSAGRGPKIELYLERVAEPAQHLLLR
jgi:hypothetical protein